MRAGAGYKPKTMATRFLAPSMRQVVHPVRRLPRHSTRMLQEGKMEGGMVNSIPIHDAAIPPIRSRPLLNILSIFEFVNNLGGSMRASIETKVYEAAMKKKWIFSR